MAVPFDSCFHEVLIILCTKKQEYRNLNRFFVYKPHRDIAVKLKEKWSKFVKFLLTPMYCTYLSQQAHEREIKVNEA